MSVNTALVQAAARLAPIGTCVSIYGGLGELPPFNPDLDGIGVPASVFRFRAALEACDAVLISSPEYAHGVSGVLKNALDWVVGSGELINKPVALINASARAIHAHASLTETLNTMSANVIADASVTVPLDGATADTDSIAADVRYSALLRSALRVLAAARAVPHSD
jgi:NAD(P)H-dependent FMN reductase